MPNPKPPEIEVALAWVERHLPECLSATRYPDGTVGKGCGKCQCCTSLTTLRALAAQPERAVEPLHSIHCRGWRYKNGGTLATADMDESACTCRAVEPPDAGLVEWAKAHLNVHKMSRHNWCCAVCDAARYILRAAGRGGDDG